MQHLHLNLNIFALLKIYCYNMSKKLVLLKSPVATRSGYGSRGRDIALALINSDKYDVRIASTPWGWTPMDALDSNNPEHKKILDRLVLQLDRQPDVYIQHTIPNEFERLGKINIGLTAGIETTACKNDWITGCNRMDLILVSSKHSADVLKQTSYQVQPKNQSDVAGILRINKPVEVLFEGIDTDLFKKGPVESGEIKKQLDLIEEEFCFLFVGHWLQGNLGQDRKDVGMLVKVFCDIFRNKPPRTRPALILKTSGATFSITDRKDIENKLESLFAQYEGKRPNVYLLHGDLTDEEMNQLYNHRKVKAMVSFAKGEGFGRPLLEFTTTGKPVITSNWSGPVDFMHKEYSVLLPGQLTKVDKSAVNDWVIADSKWFTVDYPQAANALNDVYKHYDAYRKKAENHIGYTNRNFSKSKMETELVDILERELNKLPNIEVKSQELPKLKKIN